jgi:hypothetical protein
VRKDGRPVFDLDDVVDDAAHCVAGRRERAADVQQVVPQLAQPISRQLGGRRLDAVLELVDLRVERVD